MSFIININMRENKDYIRNMIMGIIHSCTINDNYTYHLQQCQVKIEKIGLIPLKLIYSAAI